MKTPKKSMTLAQFREALPDILKAFEVEAEVNKHEIETNTPDDWLWDISIWAQNRDWVEPVQ